MSPSGGPTAGPDTNTVGSASSNTRLNQVSGVSTLFCTAVTVIQLLRGLGRYLPDPTTLTWTERLDMLLKLSILVLIAHALSWLGLERFVLGKEYSSGRIPRGPHAAVMSLSLTLPALTIPLVYAPQGKALLLPNHFHGAILAVMGGAIAYVLLFGADDNIFPGIREIILRRFRQHPLVAEIVATLAYALILIVLIATPYRLIVLPGSPLYADVGWPVLASLLTSFGLMTYILLKYPDSLETSSHWGFLRGIMAGIFTVLSVCTALYS